MIEAILIGMKLAADGHRISSNDLLNSNRRILRTLVRLLIILTLFYCGISIAASEDEKIWGVQEEREKQYNQ